MYIYHLVPKDLNGNILYPLNTLKSINHDLYLKKAKKYEGREATMENRLPILNCLWNDVIHFSPVHPGLIKDALIEAGMMNIPPIEYFEIDTALFDPKNTIVFLNKNKPKFKMDEDNFELFIPEKISSCANIPDETKEYFKKCIEEKVNPLGFYKIPHILYKGDLNIENVKRITI